MAEDVQHLSDAAADGRLSTEDLKLLRAFAERLMEKKS
jgi:hypothetical protein